MCGLAGAIYDPAAIAADRVGDAVGRIADALRRRGPDGSGCWSDAQAGVTLAHRRLAILDLDARADQPMVSDDGRYVIVFNGEIYNFRELRAELERAGENFYTESDTEILLKLHAREGERMLSRLRGMFALLIWDRQMRSAFLARDPYGIKPLYVARFGQGFLVASQVRALLASGLIASAPDTYGQAGFWLLGSVPEPHTWYRDVEALPAGSWCRIENGVKSPAHRYWDVGDAWRSEAPESRFCGDLQERVAAALRGSVRAHLVSDVPVGVFLSGGVDSGALAALMREEHAGELHGVTIAFEEFAGTPRDEVPRARRLAELYDIRHHVRVVTRAEFTRDLPRILAAMDEPSIDGVNTWYATKAVAEIGLKVVVSGVGGDELFRGYSSFRQLPALVRAWRRGSKVPGVPWVVDTLMKRRARATGNARWGWLARLAAEPYGAYWLRRGVFAPDELPALMVSAASAAPSPEQLIRDIGGSLPKDLVQAVGLLETSVYLRNQLLRDSDWASMDHGVELRTPLVDAWLLREVAPLLGAIRVGAGKRLLAASPRRPLPEAIVRTAKTGFGLPLERWLGAASDPPSAGSRAWARRVAAAYAAPAP